MIKSKRFSPLWLIMLLVPLLAVNIFCGLRIHQLALERARIKKDYGEINNIRYGLLSVDAWKGNIEDIISDQIENFNLSENQEAALKQEISKVLNSLITEVDSILQRDQGTV